MAKEMGDQDGEGIAYTNLGDAYRSLGDVDKAVQYFTQHLSIAKKLGDRLEEARVYHNLGICHLDLSDHIKAVAYFEAQDAMAIDLKLGHVRAHAALGMGVSVCSSAPKSRHSLISAPRSSSWRAVRGSLKRN